MNYSENINDQNNSLEAHDLSMENPPNENFLHASPFIKESVLNDASDEQVDSSAPLSSSTKISDETVKEILVDAQNIKVSGDISNEDDSEDETISTTILLAQIRFMSQQLEVMQKSFDTKLKYDANKEEIIQYQRQELRKYQDDLHFKILRPIIMDIIAIHDDMSNLIQYEMQRDEIEDTAQKMINNLISFQGSIETILEHQGVTSYQSDSDVYDSKLQKVRKIIKTTDITLDGKIAKRLSKGFRYEEKNLRPEEVRVYKYSKLLTESENKNQSEIKV